MRPQAEHGMDAGGARGVVAFAAWAAAAELRAQHLLDVAHKGELHLGRDRRR